MEAVRTGFLEYTDKVFRRSGYEIHGVLWTYLKCSYPMKFSSVEEDTFSSMEERGGSSWTVVFEDLGEGQMETGP